MSEQVFDRRARGWYWVDDAFIDKHARNLTPGAQCLYQFYARHSDKAGYSNYSRREKAETLGLSESTVKNADRELADKGYTRVERTLRDNGSQSNNAVYLLPLEVAEIQAAHAEQSTEIPRGQDLPRGYILPPLKDSVVVSFQESNLENLGDKTITEIPLRGVDFTPPSKYDPPPLSDEAVELIEDLESYGVASGRTTADVLLIVERPEWEAETCDILDYYDAWNQYAADFKKLMPAWIAKQIQNLAAMSPNSPREFRWMDHAPPKAAKPEYWKRYTGETDPWKDQEADPNSMYNQLGKEQSSDTGTT